MFAPADSDSSLRVQWPSCLGHAAELDYIDLNALQQLPCLRNCSADFDCVFLDLFKHYTHSLTITNFYIPLQVPPHQSLFVLLR